AAHSGPPSSALRGQWYRRYSGQRLCLWLSDPAVAGAAETSSSMSIIAQATPPPRCLRPRTSWQDTDCGHHKEHTGYGAVTVTLTSSRLPHPPAALFAPEVHE